MQSFFDWLNDFIYYFWSLTNWADDYIDVVLNLWPIAVVFVLSVILIKLFKMAPKFNSSNENSYNSGIILKNPSIARAAKITGYIFPLYMVPWVLYIISESIYESNSEEIIANILPIAIMVSAVAVMLFFLLKPGSMENIGGLYFEPKNVIYIFLGIAGAVFVAQLFSGIFFESAYYMNLKMAMVIVLSCYLANYVKSLSASVYLNTLYYFNDKTKYDTYVKSKLNDDVKAQIISNLALAANQDSAEQLNCQEQLRKRFADMVKTSHLNNDEYLQNMNEALSILQPMKLSYSESQNSYERTPGSAAYIECKKTDYSVGSYKSEAIKKVFDALGCELEPTAQNYISFRKTAELLNDIYYSESVGQHRLYTQKIEKDYQIIANGVAGEKIVTQAVAKMKNDYPDMKIFENFRFRYTEDATAECDLLIITTGGIFCVEVKNYGQDSNYSLEIAANGTWYKRYGQQLHQIDSDPFRQNHMHAEALMQKFGNEFSKLTGNGSIPHIYELVVVPNNIQIINNSLGRVLHIGGLFEFIRTETQKFDKAAVDEVAKNISSEGLPAIKYEQIDFVSWAKEINELERLREMIRNFPVHEMALSEKYRII